MDIKKMSSLAVRTFEWIAVAVHWLTGEWAIDMWGCGVEVMAITHHVLIGCDHLIDLPVAQSIEEGGVRVRKIETEVIGVIVKENSIEL